jgi:hypothetical protein
MRFDRAGVARWERIVNLIDNEQFFPSPRIQPKRTEEGVRWFQQNSAAMYAGTMTPPTEQDARIVFTQWYWDGVPQCVRDGEQANTSLSRFFTDADNLQSSPVYRIAHFLDRTPSRPPCRLLTRVSSPRLKTLGITCDIVSLTSCSSPGRASCLTVTSCYSRWLH